MQVTSGISGDVCLQTLTDTTLSGRYGSHHGSWKILFTNHISQEVNYDDNTSWRIWNPT
jgi:hypothetical protein